MAMTHSEQGAATLVVTAALLLGAATWVLTSARTQWLARRIIANEVEQTHLENRLGSGLEETVAAIASDYRNWQWVRTDALGNETHLLELPSSRAGPPERHAPALGATLMRNRRFPHLLRVRIAAPDDASSTGTIIEQVVRPLSILSPAGEVAPPLVIDGCVLGTQGKPDIYPAMSPESTRTPAIWTSRPGNCQRLSDVDLHGGTISTGQFSPGSLWTFLLNVDRKSFAELADEERRRTLNPELRRYWWVREEDLTGGRWVRSLGSAQRPVAVIFPAEVGCPPIVDGTRLVGLVVYEGDCAAQDGIGGNIDGTLAFAGSLAALRDRLVLTHISRTDAVIEELQFPVLAVVRLPGTWRDFR